MVTDTSTDDIVLWGGKPYDPSVSLTSSGFKGNKNITVLKTLMYPKYYERLCVLLPNSVFNPKHDEGLAKETVCLSLITNAYYLGMHPLLHFEL